MTLNLNWQKYNIIITGRRQHGNVKVVCPNCKDTRHNPKDTSLSCNLDNGTFHCHHCGWSGCVAEHEDKTYKQYTLPAPRHYQPLSEKAVAWFAGRGISQITLADMKVTEGNEFMPQDGKEMNTVQFNYYREGVLVNTKFRDGHKHFKLVSGAELLPYNLDAIKGEKTCIITEGEMDALSFVEVGFRNVVSVPNGANANLDYLNAYVEDYFEDKETIYIASDTDEKGCVLRDELIRRFGAEVCKVVTYGDGCKDANEHLIAYGAESLRECISKAKELDIEGVNRVSDINDSIDNLFDKGLQRGLTIGISNFDELCSFEGGMLGVITGIPNSGKSEFLDEIVERLNYHYGWKWGFFSPENEPMAFHVSKIMEKITGKHFGRATMSLMEYQQAKAYINDNFFFINPKSDFRMETILAKARVLVRKYGIRGLVIDPYNYVEPDMDMRESKTEWVSRMLGNLKVFAKQYDLLVFLVAHPAKMQKDKKTGEYSVPTLYDISDSAHFYNKADYGIVVHREYGEDEHVVVFVQKVRFKHLGHRGIATMKYNSTNGRFTEYHTAYPVEWDNSNHLIREQTEIAMDDAEMFSTTGEEVPY